jgi:2'-5' RNA ligase
VKLAIVTHPNLDQADRQWIESFRTQHDPQASRLGVHFTLVFPVVAVPGELEPEIAMVALSTRPISFTIRGGRVVRDVLGNGCHIFLVPDEGGAQIATLHDRLYAGALRAHLRTDMPFVAHMTVGAVPDSQVAERLLDELAAGSRIVRGTVADIELVDVGAPRVRSIATYALGNGIRHHSSGRHE